MAATVKRLSLMLMTLCFCMPHFLIINGIGSSASLTVEGGISLVGPHCPGTARLFCEGVDLTALRWYFNRNIDNDIETFLPDDTARTVTTLPHPAFISVELVSANRTSNQVLGNFLSFLTVDLFQLEQQNVTDISCGGPGIVAAVNVNISIIKQSVPSDPQISDVESTQYSTNELSIIVVWTTLVAECPEYKHQIDYITTIANANATYEPNSTTCESSCTATFYVPSTGNHKTYTITLQARNALGMSNAVTHSVVLVKSSEGCLSGGTLVAAVTVTLVLSCTLGPLISVFVYHMIRRKMCYSSGRENKIVQNTKESKKPRPKRRQIVVYEEPDTKFNKKNDQVELKVNESYGQGQNRIRESQQEEEDIEHSYEFVDQ